MRIEECHLQDAWKEAVWNILLKGKHVKDERGQQTLELLNLVVNITKPLSSRVPEEYPLGENALERYEMEMVKPTLDGFVYTYGNRLRYYFKSGVNDVSHVTKVDQLAETILRLKENSKSRRATMVTWDPSTDPQSEEVPCMIMVDFKIRDDILYTTGVWRSHDIFGAYPANFVALRNLAMYTAKELRNMGETIKVGPLTTQSISAHIYEHDWDAARVMFKKGA